MSIETTPRSNGEYEAKPMISYEEYRKLCDDAQPDLLRNTGIPTAEDYEAAKNNPKTIYAEIYERSVPLFTPLEHISGYNPESSQRLTESDNIFVLSLPFELINSEEIDISPYLTQLDENAAIIVETSSNRTNEIKVSVDEMIPGSVHDFIDPRLKGERQTASISVYMAYMNAFDEEGNLLPKEDEDLAILFEQDREVTGIEDTELIEASRIRHDEELFDELWDLHDDRFDWLGQYHPVSMQENKGFFKEILSNDHTQSFVRFDTNEEGERVPVCHGCIMDGLDQIEWLNDRFKNQVQANLDPENERVQFFYGIVGKTTEGKMAHYAKDVIGLDARLMKRSGGKTIVIFESTNMSSGYIPRMISQYTSAEPNGVKLAEDIKTLSKLDYWYFKPKSHQTEVV